MLQGLVGLTGASRPHPHATCGITAPMDAMRSFYPARLGGAVFHLLAVGLLGGLGALGLWRASLAGGGADLALSLSLPLITGVSAPWLIYRLYALWRAVYTLERDGVRLRWGLRQEDIPADRILWAGEERDLPQRLPRPALQWPGAVLGLRRLEDGREVEYLASRAHNLVLLATNQRVFALSPADPGEFLRAYRSLMELGTVQPLAARSQYPTFLLFNFWTDRLGRALVLGALVLAAVLWLAVAAAVPERVEVALRFTASGLPGEYSPAGRLFLLPVLNSLVFLADLILGLFFYRREELRSLAYLTWSASLLTGALFLAAAAFILILG